MWGPEAYSRGAPDGPTAPSSIAVKQTQLAFVKKASEMCTTFQAATNGGGFACKVGGFGFVS